MTDTDTVMLIISILMILGSVAWTVWDLRRKDRQRQNEFDAWVAAWEKKISEERREEHREGEK